MKKTLLSLLLFGCIANSLFAQQFTEYSVPSQNIFNPREFTTGDIDGDGYIDIIVPENTNSSISILYGTGDLSSYTMIRYTLVDPTVSGNMKPWAIVIMDIDEDNSDDIVFSNYANTVNATDGVYWMKNTGSKTFGNVQLIRFHGLLHKKGVKRLHIQFLAHSENIECIITDNGIGRKASELLSQNRKNAHLNMATSSVQKRFDLYKKHHNMDMHYQYDDLTNTNGDSLGTKVTITIPLMK